MREANSSARLLLRDPTATISCLVWARTDSMNRSAIQPEPRMPQRRTGASLAGLIRDAGNDVGNDMECSPSTQVANGVAVASTPMPYKRPLTDRVAGGHPRPSVEIIRQGSVV